MTQYVKFNVDHDAQLHRSTPATQEEKSSESSKSSKGTPPIVRCPASKGEEQSSTASERKNTQHSAERAAIPAIPAIPEEQNSKNSKNSNPEPLTQYYPCIVCGRTERWDDHGIWRCRGCWPPARHGEEPTCSSISNRF
jgi:hypothetical protein